VRYAFIKVHRTEFPVKAMCRVLRVGRSGYYDWLTRPQSSRRRRREELTGQVRRVHQESGGIYGSPRVCVELKEQGVAVCRGTVAKLMKEAGIRSVVARRFVPRTTDLRHDHPVAGNVLGRNFTADEPDRVWCTDVTCVRTGQGWLYVAGVMDLCTRGIVGWAAADTCTTALCLAAPEMALERRRPAPGLVHHSDRGVQYASEAYQSVLARHGIVGSMSRKGDCYDNAAMESFWSSYKREEVYAREGPYATRQEARAGFFEYTECWYNRRRRHSSLGYRSPMAFEASLN
jgi:transposase InsO family protein